LFLSWISDGPKGLPALLSLDDFSGLDAAGAHAHTLAGSPDECLNRLQVHIPATTGSVVGVGDVVAELRALAAEITFLRHVLNSNLSLQLLSTGTLLSRKNNPGHLAFPLRRWAGSNWAAENLLILKKSGACRKQIHPEDAGSSL
jgi:hypothetical protein